MKRGLLFACALALALSFGSNTASAHPFLGSMDNGYLDGAPQVNEGNLLAKLVKRVLFRQKVADALPGKLTDRLQQFKADYQGKIKDVLQRIRDKAQEQGITVGDFVPENQEQIDHEAAVDQRQAQVIEKLQALQGVDLEKGFLKWASEDCDRLERFHDRILEKLGDRLRSGLRNAIEDNKTALEQLKQEAQSLLGQNP